MDTRYLHALRERGPSTTPTVVRMQFEILNRNQWNARLELARMLYEDLDIWHNRKRRQSLLG